MAEEFGLAHRRKTIASEQPRSSYGTAMSSRPLPTPCGSDALSRVADPTPPAGFQQFWATWHDRVWAIAPSLDPLGDLTQATRGAAVDGLTHSITSVGGVRLGCRVDLPIGSAAPRGVAIVLHGYGMSAHEPVNAPSGLLERGLATITLRVRGYPGSQADTGDLLAAPGGYAVQSLDNAESWIVGEAVADVVCAFRAARACFGDAMPVAIQGESFGAGLAVVAASTIAARDGVFRLSIALPTLGDWAWRLAQPGPQPAGASLGDHVRAWLAAHPDRKESALRTLRLFDAVTHARRVACPVVCKLALHDDVVPAPAAAAVFNALGASPGWKWRFVTRTGHGSGAGAGTVADLRRHALFARLADEFLDPVEYPQELMKRWEPLLGEGVQPPTPAA